VVVAIETDHQLVTRGPYRWLRHPAYTGGFLAMIGFHLAMGGWVSTLLTAITLLPSFIYRIKVEEEVLLSVFGAEYQAYRHRTWRLFPGW
jgi:protein-S-isoprenylcysteine O-methyltransferase Ste14